MSINLELIEQLVRSELRWSDGADELSADPQNWPEAWREEFVQGSEEMHRDGYLSLREAQEWVEIVVRSMHRLGQRNPRLK